MSERKKGLSRREFLGRSGVAGGMILFGADSLIPSLPSVAPSDRIRVAMVGLGRQGMRLLHSFMRAPGVEVAALCDVNELVLRKASSMVPRKKGQSLTLSTDIRRLLDDRFIDVVSIATPNHWHALMGIWALQAGKDCYIESPCSHSFQEGKQLVSAARKYKRLVQYGQLDEFATLDPVEVAALGSIRNIRAVSFVSAPQRREVEMPRLNDSHYDLFLGPAEPVEGRRHLDWRRHAGMSNGPLAFFALDEIQQSVRLIGGKFPCKVLALATADRANVTGGPTITVQMEFRNVPSAEPSRITLEVVPLIALSTQTKQLIAHQLRSERVESDAREVSQITVNGSRGSLSITQMHNEHCDTDSLVHNFVAAVRAAEPELLVSPIEQGHLVAGVLHLANTSLQLQRPVVFDITKDSAVEDREANQLLQGSHRKPYALPRTI